MAYKSSDGQAFTNRDAMKSHDASVMAKKPAAAEPDGDEQGQGLSDPAQVQEAVQQVLTQVQQGQQPDPAMAKAICDYFEQFAGGDNQMGAGSPVMS